MSSIPNARGWVEIKVAATLTALATVAVFLRFLARRTRRIKFELDDWLALASLVWIFAMLIQAVLFATIGGSGKHFGTLSPNQIQSFFKIFLANEFTYSITSPLVKLSLIVFYRRIFITPGFRRTTNIFIAMCILWGLATFISSSLQCRPLKAYWDIAVEGKCFDLLKFVKGIQSVNVFLDTAILCLPMKPVWDLRRPWQDKLALTAVFLLGGFVVFASIFRLVVLFWISLEDISYTAYDGTVWTFVEPCIGLVCSCLPVIRSLFPAFKSKNPIKNSASLPIPRNSRPDLDSYGSQRQYIKMDDYTCNINGGNREGTPSHPGRIMVRTNVRVVS